MLVFGADGTKPYFINFASLRMITGTSYDGAML
jgi:hypothetical protein